MIKHQIRTESMKKIHDIIEDLHRHVHVVLTRLSDQPIEINELVITPCKKEFAKDFTLVLFGLAKKLRKNPEVLGDELGKALMENQSIQSYEVIKGFLNFSLPDQFWIDLVNSLQGNSVEEQIKLDKTYKYLIEYCSPNTNKPLHLGHVRNILLGWSVYLIQKSLGHEVFTTQVINDRGIAICKSMLAWTKFGEGQTPESTGIKSDHFVGDYYVLFETKFREEYLTWQNSEEGKLAFENSKKADESEADFYKRFKNEYFSKISPLGQEASEMLRQWERGDEAIISLWSRMNQWVYDGFEKTQNLLGVSFDFSYYESQTYLLGKDLIQKGLDKGVFQKSEDGAVFVDLTDAGLDKKFLLRSDGTSIYITQDLGTATQRHLNHGADRYIYIVADEQDYHFQVLFEILRRLEVPFSDGLYHLNYGMVELPTGRMKSREGTVVDADDLINEVIREASVMAQERGELENLSKEDKDKVISQIGLSALKYQLLKVHPKKRMIFDPTESVDLQGNTGPYIMNAYVRIQSILRKTENLEKSQPNLILQEEKDLLNLLIHYPKAIQEAGHSLDPSQLANYVYQMAKDFHKYYHDVRILNAETQEAKLWRLNLIGIFSNYLSHGMSCLGIEMPDRM